MAFNIETKFDFDRKINTEARFAIRNAMEKMVSFFNAGETQRWTSMFSDALVIEGFSDIPELKESFVYEFSKRFNGMDRMMRFPELKLSYDNLVFKLSGTYEEYYKNLLVKEGRIILSLVKIDDGFLVTHIDFDPRMLVREDV